MLTQMEIENMKYIICITLSLLFLPVSTQAETMYISDIIKITLRSGPGIDHKITKILQSGQRVEIVETSEDWSMVRLPEGKEGWVLNRFLKPDVPNRILLKNLNEDHEKLMKQYESLREENTTISAQNKQFTSDLADTKLKLNKISREYKTLKTESAGFLELKTKHKKISEQLVIITQKAEELERGIINKYITAGLCGAGILLLGYLLGFSAKRQRRRSLL